MSNIKSIRNQTFTIAFSILLFLSFLPLSHSHFLNLIFASHSSAATYYIDAANGRDTNTGLSESNPWQTIAKVNASSFWPGDQILFKRGQVWREQLTVPSSGSSIYPIVFGAYGKPFSPIINGSDQLIGLDAHWTFIGNNVWRLRIGYLPPNAVIFDTTQIGKNDGVLDAKYKWRYDAPNLEVFSVENPTSYYSSTEVTRRERAIYGWHKYYITIQDLTLTKAQHQGIFNLGGRNWTITNVTVSYNHHEGIRLWGEDTTEQYR